jgi:glycogen debranching enzyme
MIQTSLLAWLLAGLFFTFSPMVDAQAPDVPPPGMPRPQLTFPGQPSLQAAVGAAHQLALENLLTLNTIRDPKQNHNRSGLFRDPPGTFIRAGGDYQTPWTRDTSINSWNAASLLSPEVARNTLWAVVERRNGKLIVQQDNQWWDQVIWVAAIWNHYLVTGDQSIVAPAYETAVQTLAERRSKNFNAKFGLFAGPSFFNDGISGYPPPLSEPGGGGPSFVLDHPGTDKIMALSTNCVCVAAYRAAANLARELGRPTAEAENLDAQADAVAESINRHLWIADGSTYGYFLHGAGPDEGKLEKYQEGAGWAFAILFGVADAEKARALVAGEHRDPKGIPSIWPNFPGFSDEHPGRHNNVIWPLVNGLWANAAATTGATEVMADEILGMANLALASNDFREIYNARTGAVDGGWQGGHWESARHQTWSATSFLGALYRGVFGLQFERDGLRFAPHLPAHWSGISLTDLPYRTGMLDLTLTGAGSSVMRMTFDGKPLSGGLILAADLAGRHHIEIAMAP